MKNINIIDDIHLPVPDAPTGVMVSGGADSALLLYLLLKNTSHRIHVFSLASQQKLLTTTKASVDVVSKCTELANNYNLIHHIQYVTEQTKENLFEAPKLFLKESIVKFMFSGVTKNPPLHITDTFNNRNTENTERDPTVVRTTSDGDFFAPWNNLDKQDISRIYEKYNLMDTLYPCTRSCEWTRDMGDVPNPHSGHCGVCWWCEERLWGFGKL